jgi:hypothetical protein
MMIAEGLLAPEEPIRRLFKQSLIRFPDLNPDIHYTVWNVLGRGEHPQLHLLNGESTLHSIFLKFEESYLLNSIYYREAEC